MPRPTPQMTVQSWSSASEGLSVSWASGLIGLWLCHASGLELEGAGIAESTDQVTGTSSALTCSYPWSGRVQVPLRPLIAVKSPDTPRGMPGSAPVSGHAWLACGPCHQPPGPAQLCCTTPAVSPVISSAVPPGGVPDGRLPVRGEHGMT
jgi:hypothetical protein